MGAQKASQAELKAADDPCPDDCGAGLQMGDIEPFCECKCMPGFEHDSNGICAPPKKKVVIQVDEGGRANCEQGVVWNHHQDKNNKAVKVNGANLQGKTGLVPGQREASKASKVCCHTEGPNKGCRQRFEKMYFFTEGPACLKSKNQKNGNDKK